MLYRSLSVAIIILLSWFAFTSMQSSQQLSVKLGHIKQSIDEQAESSAADQVKNNEKMAAIEAFITSQHQLSRTKKQVDIKLAKQKKVTQLYATYSSVMKAELLRLSKQYTDAARVLKSTKKDIWKAGDTYPDKQKKLRALMPKIDTLVNAWKQGDGAATAKPVYLVLERIVQEKGK